MTIWEFAYLLIFFGMVSYILWKDNPWFRIGQYIGWGGTVGYRAAAAFDTIYKIGIIPMASDITLVIPIVLGLLLFVRFVKSFSFLRRIPIAVQVGTILAVGVIRAGTDLGTNVKFFLNLNLLTGRYTAADNILLLAVSVFTMIYFIFTREKTGFGYISSTKGFEMLSKIGRYVVLFVCGFGIAGTVAGLWGMSMIGTWKDVLIMLGLLK